MAARSLERSIALAVIDDHDVVVAGVRSWVQADPHCGVHIVMTGSSIDAVDELLALGPQRVDVVLLDLELKRTMAVDRIHVLAQAGFRVVVFSLHSGPARVKEALDGGAAAYLTKEEGAEHLLQTVIAVAADRPYVTPSLAGGIVVDPRLSEREREALLLWFQGMDMAAVARRMTKSDGSGENITKETARQYIERARVKYTHVGRPATFQFALLARAIEDGLVRPEDVTGYRSTAS